MMADGLDLYGAKMGYFISSTNPVMFNMQDLILRNF